MCVSSDSRGRGPKKNIGFTQKTSHHITHPSNNKLKLQQFTNSKCSARFANRFPFTKTTKHAVLKFTGGWQTKVVKLVL